MQTNLKMVFNAYKVSFDLGVGVLTPEYVTDHNLIPTSKAEMRYNSAENQ